MKITGVTQNIYKGGNIVPSFYFDKISTQSKDLGADILF